ncbi:MAG: hypothetical protein ACE5EB_04905 [Thermodesulfobacteriota bacterium]
MAATIIVIIIIAAVGGGITAALAWYSGRSAARWWLYGFFLFPAAIVQAIMLIVPSARVGEGKKTCGYCRKKVNFSATHCPKCGYEFIDFS